MKKKHTICQRIVKYTRTALKNCKRNANFVWGLHKKHKFHHRLAKTLKFCEVFAEKTWSPWKDRRWKQISLKVCGKNANFIYGSQIKADFFKRSRKECKFRHCIEKNNAKFIKSLPLAQTRVNLNTSYMSENQFYENWSKPEIMYENLPQMP